MENNYKRQYTTDYFFWPMVFGDHEAAHFDVTRCHDHYNYATGNIIRRLQEKDTDVNMARGVDYVMDSMHSEHKNILENDVMYSAAIDKNNRYTTDMGARPPLERFMFINQPGWLSFSVSALLNFFLFFSLVPFLSIMALGVCIFLGAVFQYLPFSNQLHDYSTGKKYPTLLMVPVIMALLYAEVVITYLLCLQIGVRPDSIMSGLYASVDVDWLVRFVL